MTSRRALAKRPRQRGAAIFIVVMVVTLLTAVGVFAARSASLVDAASGYSRLALQSQYVAEYGGLVFSHVLGSEVAPKLVQEGATGAEDCLGTQGVDTTSIGEPFCLEANAASLENWSGFDLFSDGTSVVPGSLDPFQRTVGSPGTVEGRVHIEMTEPILAGPQAGTAADDETAQLLTLTISGTVTPMQANSAVCTDEGESTAGVQMVRGQLIVKGLQQ